MLTHHVLVQSLLLMCYYCQGSLRLEQTWTLHGLAARTAQQLGLHSRAASKGLSALDSEIRKRTWFGCVLLDRCDIQSCFRLCVQYTYH